MSWLSTLAGAGPWAAFLLLLCALLYAFYRDKIISSARYKRREQEHEGELALERRISTFHEQRALVAEAARDRAVAQLEQQAAALPEALRQLRGAIDKAGAP